MWTAVCAILSCAKGQEKTGNDDNRPRAAIQVGDQEIEALFDSGAGVTIVAWKVYLQMMNTPKMTAFGTRLNTANGGKLDVKGQTILPMKIGSRRCWRPCIIVDGLNAQCIIGIDTMEAEGISIEAKRRVIRIERGSEKIERSGELKCTKRRKLAPGKVEKIKVQYDGEVKNANILVTGLHRYVEVIEAMYSGKPGNVMNIRVMNKLQWDIELEPGEVLAKATVTTTDWMYQVDEIEPVGVAGIPRSDWKARNKEFKFDSSSLDLTRIPIEHRSSYEQLIHQYEDVFSVDPNDVGRCDVVKQDIRLKDVNKVCSTPPYRLPHHLLPVARSYVEKLLASNIIRASISPFSSPLMLVRKPGKVDPNKPLVEQFRVVHDFRRLNAETVKDAYPMRNLFGMIDEVSQGTIFTVIDLAQGYWNQSLTEESKEKTAFGVPGMGHYEYNRSAQGLCNSGAAFQRLLDYVTRGLKAVFVYIDDVIVVSRDHQTHLKQLEQVFIRFRRYGLKCRLSKLQLGAREVNYLGYNISADSGIRPGQLKTETIKAWQPPTDITQIKQFLGLCSFFRRTIPYFSQIAAPLTKLTRKDATWKSGNLPNDALKAFTELKQKLGNRPCVKSVDYDKEFILTVDSSLKGVGAILSQVHNGIEHPCAYASRTLNSAEKNYAATHLEAMGILWSCRHFRPYLMGKHFTIRTDHKPLLALNSTNGHALDRIYAEMEEFLPYTITYLPGNVMPADGLSRMNHVESIETAIKHSQVGISHEQIIDMQKQDKYIKALLCFVRYGISPDSPKLRRFVNALKSHVKIINGVLGIYAKEAFLILTPFQLHKTILEIAHDNALSGHLGWVKTLARIQEAWFWPGMQNDVKTYCTQCHICLSVNQTSSKHPLPLEPLEPATRFNERIHLDLIGPLPKTALGNTYLLVISDAFSSYVTSVGLPNKRAETVTSGFINTWITQHSIPELIVSDQGSEFTSTVFRQTCENMGIKQNYSSAGHAQSNGQVERANKSIIEYFRKFVEENPDWEVYLQSLQFALNTAIHSTKHQSPFFMAFGRRPTIATTLLSPIRTYSENELDQQISVLSKLIKDVVGKQQHAFNQQKQQFDKRAKIKTGRIGDIVYITRPHSGKLFQKFQKQYDGPYTIVEILDHNNYKLQHIQKQKAINVHMNRIKFAPFQQQIRRDVQPRTKSDDAPKLPTLHQRTLDNLHSSTIQPPPTIYDPSANIQPRQRTPSPESPNIPVPPSTSPASASDHDSDNPDAPPTSPTQPDTLTAETTTAPQIEQSTRAKPIPSQEKATPQEIAQRTSPIKTTRSRTTQLGKTLPPVEEQTRIPHPKLPSKKRKADDAPKK